MLRSVWRCRYKKCVFETRSTSRTHGRTLSSAVLSQKTATATLPTTSPTFQEIFKGIRNRRDELAIQNIEADQHDIIMRRLWTVSNHSLRQIPTPGDLVITRKLDVLVVLDRQLDMFRVSDPTGNVTEMSKSHFIARLGKIIDSSGLANCIIETHDEDATTTPVQLVMTAPVKTLVCQRLKSFLYRSSQSTNATFNIVANIINAMQSQTETLNVTLLQFASEVDRYLEEHATSVPESISQESLDRMSAAFNSSLSFSPVHPGTLFNVYRIIKTAFSNCVLVDGTSLTILSRDAVSALKDGANNSHAGFSRDSVNALVKSYGLGDISPTNLELQSAALSVLRQSELLHDEDLDPTDALALSSNMGELDVSQGPYFESSKYAFLRNLSTAFPVQNDVGPTMPDFIEKLRTQVDEPAYCIDDASAVEIDDAVSISQAGSLYKVKVHIADPTSSIPNIDEFWKSQTLKHAFKQTTTVYFPHKQLPLFPDTWKSAFSLEAAHKCLTISFLYDPYRRKVISSDVHPSWLSNVKQITYDQVDQHLAANTNRDHDLALLEKVAQCLRNDRQKSGAIELLIPRPQCKVSNDGTAISMSLDNMTRSRVLVAELMIMANHLVAKLISRNKVPFLYRSQQASLPSELFSELSGASSKPLSLPMSFRLMPYLQGSVVGTTPFKHQSLGLSLYSHVTSPLRRFQDIVNHWQVYSFLLRAPERALSASQLDAMANHIQATQTLVKKCVDQSTLFYVLKKLASYDISEPLVGYITNGGYRLSNSFHHRVYIEKYGIDSVLVLENGAERLETGTQVTCIVEKIDPVTLTVRVKLCT